MHDETNRTALFVLPIRATPGAGPVAAWATTGGWAAGAEQVLGSARVIADDGVFDAAQTMERVSPANVSASVRRPFLARMTARAWVRLRPWLPEPAITLIKDAQRAIDGVRRARSVDPRPWRDRDVAFVWQRHALFRRCGVHLARALEVPMVLLVHAMQVEEAAGWGVARPGWTRLTERWGEQPQLRAADVVACVSESVAEAVRRRGIPEQRIVVTPNGVDTTRFRPGPADETLRDRLGLAGRFVVGWSGSFRGFHGLDVAIEGVVRLQDRHPELALLLVGDGQQSAAIAEHGRQLGIRTLVMPGAVPFDDVARYLRLCDVGLVLAPSTGSFHYSPVKLREYLACGLPVVAHDVGELGASLTDDEDALLVPRGDPSALVAALERLMADPALRDRLRRRGPELVAERWSWQQPVRDVLARLTENQISRA